MATTNDCAAVCRANTSPKDERIQMQFRYCTATGSYIQYAVTRQVLQTRSRSWGEVVKARGDTEGDSGGKSSDVFF